METCANCGRTIGNLERAYVFLGRVVCFDCKQRLDAQTDDAVRKVAREGAVARTSALLKQLRLTETEREYIREIGTECIRFVDKQGVSEQIGRGRMRPIVLSAIFAYCLAASEEIMKVVAPSLPDRHSV